MSLGIFTLMGLLFLVGLKNLELLPALESTQPAPEMAKKKT
jgi:hypothetical protein